MPDSHANFAYSSVATAPSPASSGTSLTVASGDGAKFPLPPFNAVVWASGTIPTTSNAEIVRVTVVATDTLTIVRAQENSTARSVIVGDQIAAAATVKTYTDIENQPGQVCNQQTVDTAILPNTVAAARGPDPYYNAAGVLTDVQSGAVLVLDPGDGNIDVLPQVNPDPPAGQSYRLHPGNYINYGDIITPFTLEAGTLLDLSPGSLLDLTPQAPVVASVLSKYGSVFLIDVGGKGTSCGALGGNDDGIGDQFVQFTVNAYLDNLGNWNRFNTSKYSMLCQVASLLAANSPTSANTSQLQIYGMAPAANPITNFVQIFAIDAASGFVGIGNDAGIVGGVIPATLSAGIQDAATNTITTLQVLQHSSTGTPAAGFGAGLLFRLQDSTTIGVNAAEIDALWKNATDGSQQGQLNIGVHDAGTTANNPRIGLITTSNGSQAIITLGSGAVFQNTSGRARVTSPVTNATTTVSNLSDLTLTLVAGRIYCGRLLLFANNSTAGEGLQIDFGGGTATFTSIEFGILAASGSTIGTRTSTAAATAVTLSALPATTDQVVEVVVTLVCNAGGTFIPRFAENTHSTGTATVQLGSYLWLEDSPN